MDFGLNRIQPQTGLAYDLHDKLRKRAKRNHRTLRCEIVSILETTILREEMGSESPQEEVAS